LSFGMGTSVPRGVLQLAKGQVFDLPYVASHGDNSSWCATARIAQALLGRGGRFSMWEERRASH
jgi:uncharacterized protein (DUF779 family)